MLSPNRDEHSSAGSREEGTQGPCQELVPCQTERCHRKHPTAMFGTLHKRRRRPPHCTQSRYGVRGHEGTNIRASLPSPACHYTPLVCEGSGALPARATLQHRPSRIHHCKHRLSSSSSSSTNLASQLINAQQGWNSQGRTRCRAWSVLILPAFRDKLI